MMEITQSHPMANKWGQGMAVECRFGVVTELSKTNIDSHQSIFSTCTVHDEGGGSYNKKPEDSSQDLSFIFCNS